MTEEKTTAVMPREGVTIYGGFAGPDVLEGKAAGQKVIATVFVAEKTPDGKRTVFDTHQASFHQFEQIVDVLGWANKVKSPRDRILKIELALDTRNS